MRITALRLPESKPSNGASFPLNIGVPGDQIPISADTEHRLPVRQAPPEPQNGALEDVE